MCKAVEDYANKKAIESAIDTAIAYGIDKERIASRLSEKFDISLEEAKKLYDSHAHVAV